MNEELKKSICEIALGASIFAAGFLFGKYSTNSTPSRLKEPDINLNKPGFQMNLTLSDKELIEKYGKRDLELFLEASMLDIFGEIQSPELKRFYNKLHIQYLQMKLEGLKEMQNGMNRPPNSIELQKYNRI